MVSCAVRQAEHWRSVYSTTTTGAAGLLAGWGPRLEGTTGPVAEEQAAKSSSVTTREHLRAGGPGGDGITSPLGPFVPERVERSCDTELDEITRKGARAAAVVLHVQHALLAVVRHADRNEQGEGRLPAGQRHTGLDVDGVAGSP